MSQNKTVILNGSRVWFALICFVIIHGGAGVWWASSVNTTLKQVVSSNDKVIEKVAVLNDKVVHNEVLLEILDAKV